MADTTHAPDLTEIRAAITARLQELQPLIDEYHRLEQANQALAAVTNGKPMRGLEVIAANTSGRLHWQPEPEPDPAPYGYKPDGTPRRSNGGRKPKARS